MNVTHYWLARRWTILVIIPAGKFRKRICKYAASLETIVKESVKYTFPETKKETVIFLDFSSYILKYVLVKGNYLFEIHCSLREVMNDLFQILRNLQKIASNNNSVTPADKRKKAVFITMDITHNSCWCSDSVLWAPFQWACNPWSSSGSSSPYSLWTRPYLYQTL